MTAFSVFFITENYLRLRETTTLSGFFIVFMARITWFFFCYCDVYIFPSRYSIDNLNANWSDYFFEWDIFINHGSNIHLVVLSLKVSISQSSSLLSVYVFFCLNKHLHYCCKSGGSGWWQNLCFSVIRYLRVSGLFW